METKNIVIWRVDSVKQISLDPFTKKCMPDHVEFEAVIKGTSCKSYYNGDIVDIHRQLDERLTDDINTMYPKTMICMPGRANGKTLLADKMVREYIDTDIATTSALFNVMMERRFMEKRMTRPSIPSIKKVIFNDPATIVFWSDDTKTVVKCQEGDTFDPEKGLAMAIAKRALGNKGNYCNDIKKWTEPYEKECEEARKILNDILPMSFAQAAAKGAEAMKKLSEAFAGKTEHAFESQRKLSDLIKPGDIIKVFNCHMLFSGPKCFEVSSICSDGTGVKSQPADYHHRYADIIAVYRMEGTDYKCIWKRSDS